MSNRLIVVSNRLPLTLRKADGHWTTERSSGGLASAMNPILRRNGGDWIGWAGASGEEDQEERRSVLEDWAQKEQCFAVELGTPNWTPVVYINRSIERAELAALYKLADVCWVGSLRDGMNLVAKEHVAYKAEGDGGQVLSEVAGAAAEMGEALLINPFDEERTASTVERALALDEDERRQRMKTLHARVLRNNVFRWGDRFLTSLHEAVSERGRYVDTQPQRLRPAEAQQAYMSAQRRLLALDDDRTLVPFTDHPQ